MLGWINQMLQAMGVEKFGADAWKAIVDKAGVGATVEGMVSTCPYADSLTYK